MHTHGFVIVGSDGPAAQMGFTRKRFGIRKLSQYASSFWEVASPLKQAETTHPETNLLGDMHMHALHQQLADEYKSANAFRKHIKHLLEDPLTQLNIFAAFNQNRNKKTIQENSEAKFGHAYIPHMKGIAVLEKLFPSSLNDPKGFSRFQYYDDIVTQYCKDKKQSSPIVIAWINLYSALQSAAATLNIADKMLEAGLSVEGLQSQFQDIERKKKDLKKALESHNGNLSDQLGIYDDQSSYRYDLIDDQVFAQYSLNQRITLFLDEIELSSSPIIQKIVENDKYYNQVMDYQFANSEFKGRTVLGESGFSGFSKAKDKLQEVFQNKPTNVNCIAASENIQPFRLDNPPSSPLERTISYRNTNNFERQKQETEQDASVAPIFALGCFARKHITATRFITAAVTTLTCWVGWKLYSKYKLASKFDKKEKSQPIQHNHVLELALKMKM